MSSLFAAKYLPQVHFALFDHQFVLSSYRPTSESVQHISISCNRKIVFLNTLVVELQFRLKPTSGHAADLRLVLTNKTLVEDNKLLLSTEKVGGI